MVIKIPHMEIKYVMKKEEREECGGYDHSSHRGRKLISIKVPGQVEGVEKEVATKMVFIEILVSSQVPIMVATVVAIKVVVMVTSKHLYKQKVDTSMMDASRTIDTKTVSAIIIKAVVVEREVVTEAKVDVEAREEVEEECRARIITKGNNLNSVFSMEFISIIILNLERKEMQIEATEPYTLLELK